MLKLAQNILTERAAAVAAGLQPGELTHIPTPWDAYNKRFRGIELGVASLLVAHTGDGKSSLLVNLGFGVASQGIPTLFISIEDPTRATADRFLSIMTGIPTQKLNAKDVSSAEGERLVSAAKRFPKALEMFTSSIDSQGLMRLVKEWRASVKGPAIILLDYLQALVKDTSSAESEMSWVTSELNDFCKTATEAGKPTSVVMASQVRSSAVTEGGARFNAQRPPSVPPKNWRDMISVFCPKMGDTEYCRAAEKKAKCYLTWWRPGRWAKAYAGWDSVADTTGELHVVKANFGPGEDFKTLKWDGPTQRIFE